MLFPSPVSTSSVRQESDPCLSRWRKKGHTVISADRSLRSLRVLAARAASAETAERVLPVVADITALPFSDGVFSSATSAETLEHIPGHEVAVAQLARVLEEGGWLIGTVPAGPQQWSDWDAWAGHLRRYSHESMAVLLEGAGLDAEVVVWGWPMLRLYDDLFLKRINRRRLTQRGSVEDDATLNRISSLGRRRHLVAIVRSVFGFDRLFDGSPWGVGLLFSAQKKGSSARGEAAFERRNGVDRALLQKRFPQRSHL